MNSTDDSQGTITEQGEQNDGANVAIMEDSFGKTLKEESEKKNKGGRPKQSKNKQKTLADLVTYRDVQRAINVMRQALNDPNSTVSIKFNAAKFLLSAKLDGLQLNQKQKALNLRVTQATNKQQQQANSKLDSTPKHNITTVYKQSTPTTPPTTPPDPTNRPSIASVFITDDDK